MIGLEDLNLNQSHDKPRGVVDDIFNDCEKRRFEPAAVEREILLNP